MRHHYQTGVYQWNILGMSQMPCHSANRFIAGQINIALCLSMLCHCRVSMWYQATRDIKHDLNAMLLFVTNWLNGQNVDPIVF